MAAQKGLDVLIKIGDPVTPGQFVTVAGLQSKTITLNAETVDVTDSDSVGRWRELLAGAGVKSCAVAGNGVFKDQPSDGHMRALFFGTQIDDFELTIPGFGTLTGLFQITTLEWGGEHAGEATHSLSLESAGPITFAAAA